MELISVIEFSEVYTYKTYQTSKSLKCILLFHLITITVFILG